MESHEGIKTSEIGRFRRQLRLVWTAIAVLGLALSATVTWILRRGTRPSPSSMAAEMRLAA